ncbi:hypothetical protein BDW67DRAFT_178997 [Aspergillus spinulosporus]
MPSLKSAVVLRLLPELLAARSISLVKHGLGDSCESFAASWGISVDDLKSLTPSLDCTNFDDFADYCVMGDITTDEPSPSSATTTTTSKEASTTTTSTTTVALTTTTEKPTTTTISTTSMATSDSPTPTQPGLASNYTIEANNGITTAQFSSWNPYINDNCSNLWLDYYVCVHVAPKPQIPDITSDCKTYHNVQDGEGCWAIDSAYSITLDQFRKWNPTIDASCSNPRVDYYVCVGV